MAEREADQDDLYLTRQPVAEWLCGEFSLALLGRMLEPRSAVDTAEARVAFEDWRKYYKTERSHRSLGLQTLPAFAKKECEQASGSPAFH